MILPMNFKNDYIVQEESRGNSIRKQIPWFDAGIDQAIFLVVLFYSRENIPEATITEPRSLSSWAPPITEPITFVITYTFLAVLDIKNIMTSRQVNDEHKKSCKHAEYTSVKNCQL